MFHSKSGKWMRTWGAVCVLIAVLAASSVFGSASALARQDVLRIGIDTIETEIDSISEDGDVSGLNIDLVEAVAGNMGYTVEWTSVDDPEIDARILPYQGPRVLEDYVLSMPYLISDHLYYKYANVRVNLNRDTPVGFISSSEPDEGDYYFTSHADGFNALIEQEIELFGANALAAGWFFEANQDISAEVEIYTTIAEMDQMYSLLVPVDNAALTEEFNASLTAIVDDGTYAEIFQQWTGLEVPDLYMEHMQFIAGTFYVQGELLDAFINMLTLPSEEIGPTVEHISTDVLPAIETMSVPGSAAARNAQDELLSYAEALLSALEGWEKGDADFNDINNATSARFDFENAMTEIVSVR